MRASAAVEVPIELPGVTLAVQDSRLPGAGQGLFVSLADGADSATISSGEVLCGYCDESTLVDEATGDKAVPFAFGDAQKLVLLAGEPPHTVRRGCARHIGSVRGSCGVSTQAS